MLVKYLSYNLSSPLPLKFEIEMRSHSDNGSCTRGICNRKETLESIRQRFVYSNFSLWTSNDVNKNLRDFIVMHSSATVASLPRNAASPANCTRVRTYQRRAASLEETVKSRNVIFLGRTFKLAKRVRQTPFSRIVNVFDLQFTRSTFGMLQL